MARSHGDGPERGIALTVFAVGLTVVVRALVGCGGGGGEPPAACSFAVDRHEGRVYGNARLLDEPEIEALLADDADCTAVPEGRAAFVID